MCCVHAQQRRKGDGRLDVVASRWGCVGSVCVCALSCSCKCAKSEVPSVPSCRQERVQQRGLVPPPAPPPVATVNTGHALIPDMSTSKNRRKRNTRLVFLWCPYQTQSNCLCSIVDLSLLVSKRIPNTV